MDKNGWSTLLYYHISFLEIAHKNPTKVKITYLREAWGVLSVRWDIHKQNFLLIQFALINMKKVVSQITRSLPRIAD